MNATLNISSVKSLAALVPDPNVAIHFRSKHHDESGPAEIAEFEEIHIRAETVTSLLKGILDLQPTTHRGFEE